MGIRYALQFIRIFKNIGSETTTHKKEKIPRNMETSPKGYSKLNINIGLITSWITPNEILARMIKLRMLRKRELSSSDYFKQKVQ